LILIHLALPICRRNPCTGGLCGNGERCLFDFKTCTHTCCKYE